MSCNIGIPKVGKYITEDRYNKFYLMNKDKPVLLFGDKVDLSGDYPILELYSEESLPYPIRTANIELRRWFKSRVIPVNRNHINKVLRSLNLQENTTPLDILKLNNGFSLNDSYWIKPKENVMTYPTDLSWDSCNLYDNEFIEALGLVTFFGNETSLGGTLNTPICSSPELTTQGIMNKAWRRLNGELYLYKRSSEGARNLGKEHIAETLAYNIGKSLGVKCIPYWFDVWHNKHCSVCEIFTSKDTGYMPMSFYLQGFKNKEIKWNLLSVLENLPPNCKQDFEDMIVFDYIIENRDRHLGNYGFLLDNETQEIISSAPLFDHGNSLMSDWLDYDFERDLEIFSYASPSFGTSNQAMAQYIISTNRRRYKHWSELLRLNIDDIIHEVLKRSNIASNKSWYLNGIKKLILCRCDIIDKQ